LLSTPCTLGDWVIEYAVVDNCVAVLDMVTKALVIVVAHAIIGRVVGSL